MLVLEPRTKNLKKMGKIDSSHLYLLGTGTPISGNLPNENFRIILIIA